MEQWIWIIVFVVALLVEVFTAGTLVSIWFSAGSLVAYFVYLLNGPLLLQIIVFLAVSIGALLAIRPLATTYFRGNTVATNADRMIGRQTTLTKAITKNSWGEVNVYGVVWSAVEINNQALDIGTEVKVVAIEGAKVIVEKIN
jgi:membrane protein implicated in regulation of membrane protease activity